MYDNETPDTRGQASPLGYTLTETTATDKTAWSRIEVRRQSVFRPTYIQGPHNLQYTFTAPDDSTYLSGLFYNSESGLCLMRAAGPYWLRAPQIGAAPASVQCVLLDGMSTDLMPAFALTEDPANWTAKFEPRVMAAPLGPITIDTTAGGLVLAAALAGRRFIYARNLGSVEAWLAFGATPVVNKGILCKPGEEKFFDALDGISEQELRGITAAGSTTFSVQTGT